MAMLLIMYTVRCNPGGVIVNKPLCLAPSYSQKSWVRFMYHFVCRMGLKGRFGLGVNWPSWKKHEETLEPAGFIFSGVVTALEKLLKAASKLQVLNDLTYVCFVSVVGLNNTID
ncbi:hypothetical protein BDBG_17748 [Blastomyces gilchristii SLH14081]|uniref:Uncharacterized protein n=1 Tax=Blastomyces gilchristii (strain SLH14081) TaxID=559298 RepID=A0A179UYN7_BLAGS|nr:uncharacterized protein BDBG_17748 [Blastomyces gilchristii SLH14081]OAT13196.1 hypothetical protein BDBG_17748 [Blastomyces gilchristii SLH14081]